MKISQNGIDFIIEVEGLRTQPYDDQTGKIIDEWCEGATIGVGHLIAKDEWDKYKNGITHDQTTNLLLEDIKRFENATNKYVSSAINQNQFDAILSFCFNVGIGNFKSSSMLKLINDSGADTIYDSLESAWKAWRKSQGKVMEGLEIRRGKEWNLYNS